jgi:hypothetical protein
MWRSVFPIASVRCQERATGAGCKAAKPQVLLLNGDQATRSDDAAQLGQRRSQLVVVQVHQDIGAPGGVEVGVGEGQL